MPTRGRPREFDEDQATDALMALFWEQGYDHVNQQQMAAATGLSTSSLYNTFGTKAETYRRVMDRYLELMSQTFAPLENGTAGIADLLAFLDVIEEQLRGPMGANGCLIVMTNATMPGRTEPALEHAEIHRRRVRAAVEAGLRRARDLGENVPDPETTATILVATFQGVMGIARATAAGEETFQHLDALRALVHTWK